MTKVFQIGHYASVSNDAEPSVADQDSVVIERCLRAAVEGPFFPDWEFQTLFGLHRSEVAAILSAWPQVPDVAPEGYESAELAQWAAVNNALNHLLGYPHGIRGEAFEQTVGASEAQVAAVLSRWRGEPGFDASARGYFDRLA